MVLVAVPMHEPRRILEAAVERIGPIEEGRMLVGVVPGRANHDLVEIAPANVRVVPHRMDSIGATRGECLDEPPIIVELRRQSTAGRDGDPHPAILGDQSVP